MARDAHVVRQLVQALLLLLKRAMLVQSWHHAPVVLLGGHVTAWLQRRCVRVLCGTRSSKIQSAGPKLYDLMWDVWVKECLSEGEAFVRFSLVRWAAVTQASAWGEILGGEMGRRKRGGTGDILSSSLKLELGPGQANRSSAALCRGWGSVFCQAPDNPPERLQVCVWVCSCG